MDGNRQRRCERARATRDPRERILLRTCDLSVAQASEAAVGVCLCAQLGGGNAADQACLGYIAPAHAVFSPQAVVGRQLVEKPRGAQPAAGLEARVGVGVSRSSEP